MIGVVVAEAPLSLGNDRQHLLEGLGRVDRNELVAQRPFFLGKTVTLLTEHRGLMDELTNRLIEEETVDYDQLAKMRDAHFAGKSLAAA